MAAKIIAVANQKGGVGKTTTAVTLSAALAKMGKRVILLDIDPHTCASIHLRQYPHEHLLTLHDVFLAALAKNEVPSRMVWNESVRHIPAGSFDMLVGDTKLEELEECFRGIAERGLVLQNILEPYLEKYEYILIDCPPHMGFLLANALMAADGLIIPIQTDFLALHGLKLLFNTIYVLNKAREKPLEYRALPTMYDKRALACSRVLHLVYKKMQKAVFETYIPIDTRFREASALGTVVYSVDAKSRGALAYDTLAQEVNTLWPSLQ